jgi:hypothetical protein
VTVAAIPPSERAANGRVADPFADKIEEWVERSGGRIRADRAHTRLSAMGYGGSERTTRRALHEAKSAYRRGRWRVYRPWIPEPGLWLQWDWGAGPLVAGRPSWLFCLWLAWPLPGGAARLGSSASDARRSA